MSVTTVDVPLPGPPPGHRPVGRQSTVEFSVVSSLEPSVLALLYRELEVNLRGALREYVAMRLHRSLDQVENPDLYGLLKRFVRVTDGVPADRLLPAKCRPDIRDRVRVLVDLCLAHRHQYFGHPTGDDVLDARTLATIADDFGRLLLALSIDADATAFQHAADSVRRLLHQDGGLVAELGDTRELLARTIEAEALISRLLQKAEREIGSLSGTVAELQAQLERSYQHGKNLTQSLADQRERADEERDRRRLAEENLREAETSPARLCDADKAWFADAITARRSGVSVETDGDEHLARLARATASLSVIPVQPAATQPAQELPALGEPWDYQPGESCYSLSKARNDVREYAHPGRLLSEVVGAATASRVAKRLLKYRPEGGMIRVDTDGDVSTMRKGSGRRIYLGRVRANEWFADVVSD